MAIIKCKMCGGDVQLAEDKTFGTCEYCGSTMTFPKVSDEQRAAAFNRGNHFRRMGEFDKALAVYERIMAEDDTDAEAHWCCALCRFGIEYVEDPATYEWLPTCHRVSFDSFLEDVDYLAALEHSDGITRRQYQKDAAKIAEVQRGILAASRNTEPYDVFISYKELDENGERTRDSILAQEIYYRLTEKGWRVFFSRISLEDVPGTEYEPYIFAALNSAKVMIVVGTSAENLNAVWVKNEWNRYLSLMRKDRSRLLIPCYRDMDPYDLPEQLSVLMSYDMGRIGFIQDLIHGVDKVLLAEAPKEKTAPAKETVVVQQTGGPNVTALVKRGQQSLEDGEWDKADQFFDQALNMDAECAEAFIGKFCAKEKAGTLDAALERRLAQSAQREKEIRSTRKTVPEDEERIRRIIEENIVPGYLNAGVFEHMFQCFRSYPSRVEAAKTVCEEAIDRLKKEKLLSRAIKYAQGSTAVTALLPVRRFEDTLRQHVTEMEEKEAAAKRAKEQEYAAFLDQKEQEAQTIRRKAEEKREAEYRAACKKMEQAEDEETLANCQKSFLRMPGYLDSDERAERCQSTIEELREEEKRRREEERAAEEAERRRLAEERAAAEEAERRRLAEERAAAEEAERRRLSEERAVAEEAERRRRIEERKRRHLIRNLYIGFAAVAIGVGVALTVRAGYIRITNNNSAAKAAYASAGEYRDARENSVALWDRITVRHSIATSNHTVGLKGDGTVVAVGDNRYGECKVYGWKNIIAIETGSCHTLGLKRDGSVVATGLNNDGQCQVSNWTEIVSIDGGNGHTVGLKSDGTVVAVGNNDYGQCEVADWTDIVAIAAGSWHTVGLKSDGTVVATGRNQSKQCDTSSWTDIVEIDAGFGHTVGLKSDGTVVAIGRYQNGECAVSSWTEIVSVAVGARHTVGLRADGSVLATGLNGFGECNVSDWMDIVAIAAGDQSTIGLRSDGTVVAVGNNMSGQCEVSDWTDIRVPGR